MHPARRVAARAVIAIVILAMTAACTTTQGSDKTGGDTVVLTLATSDGQPPNANALYDAGPAVFVEQLGKVSGGRVKVDLKTSYGGDEAADAESKVVRAIAAGEVDGGWPSTRAFARGWVPGLEVVEAPLTITSYAAQKALVSGPVAGKLLARLEGSGMVGLGLAVGQLRRPFAANQPLLGPEDWKGITFRVFNSPTQADAVRALGATPVDVSFQWLDKINEGTLQGVELDIGGYEETGVGTQAGNITANVVLWPKVFVLALSQKRFDALTSQQQGWVREAAAQAVKASVDATYDETPAARTLCERGARFRDATPGQLQGLRARFRPVLDKLAADPTSAQLLGDLQAIAAQHPGPDTPAVPASCAKGIAKNASPGQVPTAVSDLPDGVYRHQLTHDEVAAAGGDDEGGPAGIWTLRVRGGTFQLNCRPVEGAGRSCGGGGNDSDAIFEAGHLRGTGRTVYFVQDPERLSRLTGCKLPPSTTQPDHCWTADPYRLTWALAGDQLSFTDWHYPGETGDNLTFTGGPWRKIA
jgi:TRAP-type C4-dicarboxylate transport system substrate-binding protein